MSRASIIDSARLKIICMIIASLYVINSWSQIIVGVIIGCVTTIVTVFYGYRYMVTQGHTHGYDVLLKLIATSSSITDFMQKIRSNSVQKQKDEIIEQMMKSMKPNDNNKDNNNNRKQHEFVNKDDNEVDEKGKDKVVQLDGFQLPIVPKDFDKTLKIDPAIIRNAIAIFTGPEFLNHPHDSVVEFVTRLKGMIPYVVSSTDDIKFFVKHLPQAHSFHIPQNLESGKKYDGTEPIMKELLYRVNIFYTIYPFASLSLVDNFIFTVYHTFKYKNCPVPQQVKDSLAKLLDRNKV